MEVVLRKLRERNGEIALRLSLALLIGVILLLVILNVRHAYQVTDMVIDRTNEAVLAVAAANGPKTHDGVREGEAVARTTYDGAAWQREAITSDAVLTALRDSTGATLSGSSLIKSGSYRIDNLSTSYVNFDGVNLHFTTKLDLTIYLLGGNLSIRTHQEVRTTFEEKF